MVDLNWILAILLMIPLAAGLAVIIVIRVLTKHVDKKIGEAIPLWQAALEDLRKKLTHPHPFAREMDDLMKVVGPLGHVDEEKYATLAKKLIERSLSHDPNLRPDEVDAALAYLLVWKLARNEAMTVGPFTVQLVLVHTPEVQSPSTFKGPTQ